MGSRSAAAKPTTEGVNTTTVPPPSNRRLRVYAFDPSLRTQMENAVINEVTLKIPWESLRYTPRPPAVDSADEQRFFHGLPVQEPGEKRGVGPAGEYVEVVDHDPASACLYAPVDLEDPHLLAQDGHAPSEGNPQFHQQMVYAVAMKTIENFERALGRPALWSERLVRDPRTNRVTRSEYVQRLRIYPHALRQANAYYSPAKKSLLFGYFPAAGSDPAQQMPGGMVFTCLSYDVVAHETTHALLDGLHRYFMEDSNPDVRAFHEAFADIVSLFQHFSHPEVVRHQISRTRGDLGRQNLLGELAVQFGRAAGGRGALRSAIGEVDKETGRWRPHRPVPGEFAQTAEPHARGAFLVAAVFDAFLSIYKSRVADLLRIASGGTGILARGQIHPDLVSRLSDEAAKSAQHVLTMCIRALDYCPPVDLTFGEFLRAIITADSDLFPDDTRGYRTAMIEAFRRRGIFPENVRAMSEDSLRWQPPAAEQARDLKKFVPQPDHFMPMVRKWVLQADRRRVYELSRLLQGDFQSQMAIERALLGSVGLNPAVRNGTFEVHSVRPSRRIGPDANPLVDLVVEIVQKQPVYRTDSGEPVAENDVRAGATPSFWFRGGCTLILDADTMAVRYAIYKRIDNARRLRREAEYRTRSSTTLRATYFGDRREDEPFAILHGEPEGG